MARKRVNIGGKTRVLPVTQLPPTGRICPTCKSDMGDLNWCNVCASNRKARPGERHTQERTGLMMTVPGHGEFFRHQGRIYRVEDPDKPGASSSRTLANESDIKAVKKHEKDIRLLALARTAINNSRLVAGGVNNVSGYCNKCNRNHSLYVNNVESQIFNNHFEAGHLEPTTIKVDRVKTPAKPKVTEPDRGGVRTRRNEVARFNSLVEHQVNLIRQGLPTRVDMGDSTLTGLLHERADQKAGMPNPALRDYEPGTPCPLCGTKHRSQEAAIDKHRLKAPPMTAAARREITRRMQQTEKRRGGGIKTPEEVLEIYHGPTGVLLTPGFISQSSVVERPPPKPKTRAQLKRELKARGLYDPETFEMYFSGTPHIGKERKLTPKEEAEYGAPNRPHMPLVAKPETKRPATFSPGYKNEEPTVHGFSPGRSQCSLCNVKHRGWNTFIRAHIDEHPNIGFDVKRALAIPRGEPIAPKSGRLPTPGGGLRTTVQHDFPSVLDPESRKTDKTCPHCHLVKNADSFVGNPPTICRDCGLDYGIETAKLYTKTGKVRKKGGQPITLHAPAPPPPPSLPKFILIQGGKSRSGRRA